MGYIEDIRKINALAKELLQHNIATTQDEAVVKAREMLVKKGSVATIQNGEYVDLSHPATVLPSTVRNDEWKEAMAKNNEYIIGELKSFRAAMETITKEMQGLRQELQNTKKQPGPIALQQERVEAPQVTAAVPKPEVTQPHPRAGNYTPSDVAVEKFFYFGKK